MQEVVAAIEKRVGPSPFELNLFTEAAVKWAAHCLRTHRGELLRRGLDVARALAEYDEFLLGGEPKP